MAVKTTAARGTIAVASVEGLDGRLARLEGAIGELGESLFGVGVGVETGWRAFPNTAELIIERRRRINESESEDK